jgi:hypothetical protein
MTIPSLVHPAVQPSAVGYSKFAYGREAPEMRAADLEDIVSVNVRELFGDVQEATWRHGDDTGVVRAAAANALSGVDLSRFRPEDKVNILCSEHGFSIMGGDAYAEVLRTVRDVLVEEAGCQHVQLAFSTAGSRFEGPELIPAYHLDDYFEGKVFFFGPSDRGVAIDTDIGRLYGVRRAYAADRLVHVHYDDPREIHFHRINGRSLKSFTMSYARMETRSIFHNNFPTRSANIVPRAIYESDFVQSRWGFGVSMTTSPDGVTGVDADVDLIALDRRIGRQLLLNYGKMLRLMATIDECFAIADDTRWVPYQHAGGLTACALSDGPYDHLDLDLADVPVNNPAVKALIINTAWKMGGALGRIMIAATPAVGRHAVRANGKGTHVAENLVQAYEMAVDLTGTDKAIAFDGSYSNINVSRSMAEHLIQAAPEVSRVVDEELLPKWLRQRGMALV